MQTKTPYIPTREQKSAVPLGNFDVMEDGNTLVNLSLIHISEPTRRS